MSASLVISILVVSALAGWFLATIFIAFVFHPFKTIKIAGFRVQGFIPSVGKQFAFQLKNILADYVSGNGAQTFSHPDALQKLQPEIEKHVDDFLAEKMKHAFPLIYPMMGEKTLSRFKEVFMAEVENLLPLVVNKYIETVGENFDFNQLIEKYLGQAALPALEKGFKIKVGKQLKLLKLSGLIIGLAAGLIEITIIQFLK